jgi:23S rRNA (uridine2552-2'-O)-methyltransferase
VARRGSSSRWLQRQQSDPFVKQRDQHGYRSRAAYKLHELAHKDQLIRPGSAVLDLGASPGGWTQVAVEMAGPRGKIIALDILEMEPIAGATFIHGDCRDPEVRALVVEAVGGKVDLVMSDMAPNITGLKDVDEAGMVELAEITLELAAELLRPGGGLLIKLFQFADTDLIVKRMKTCFGQVSRRKPEASRAQSREFYVVAKQYGI